MEDNKKQKKLYRILVTIAITIPIVIAISYAYFQAAILGEDPGVTGKSTDKFEIDLVTENNGYINATNVMLVKEANIASESEKGYFKVVSGNNKHYINYSLSLTELTISANLQVSDFKWQLVRDNEVVASGNFAGISSNSMTLINNAQISNNETHEYEYRIWLQETEHDQIDLLGGSFSGKITMTADLRQNPVPLTLKNAILWQEDSASDIEAKGNPSFSSISTASDTGLYATQDEYGTTYYYRGVKDELNNNLIWGGFQWKIIRINGDSSVRLIYNGTEEQFHQNGTVNSTGDDTAVFSRPWNETYYNDAKYVGYMYGGANGVASTSREDAILNETSTKIKSKLEEWYHDNIELNALSGQVADSLFCNDRSMTDSRYPGYGIGNTYFDTTKHLIDTLTPTLRCATKNDRFTVNDTSIGNGNLTYPIGLITADEAAMAGIVYSVSDITNYLYNNGHCWTFTPSFIEDEYTYVMRINKGGGIESSVVYNSLLVRPVISINGNIIITGTGAANDPYIVVAP